MKSQFLQQLEFDYWAIQKLINSMLLIDALPDKPSNLISHVFAATNIWYNRLNAAVSPYAVWERFEPKDWQAQLDLNYGLLKSYLQEIEEADFGKIVEYKTSAGIQYVSRVGDILSHLFWHSAYHQGQIVMLLKPYVDPLPDLNFISFARE